MARRELDDMARYRVRATRAKNRSRGRRQNDNKVHFWAIGWVLELAFLLLMGFWMLSACARRVL